MDFPSPRRLLGVISGMIVWAGWFVLVYGLNGLGCTASWDLIEVAGGNLLSLLKLATTVLALLLIAWCAWRGWQGWRLGHDGAASGGEATQRMKFMGLMMLVLSLLAALATVLVAVPILMLDPCAA